MPVDELRGTRPVGPSVDGAVATTGADGGGWMDGGEHGGEHGGVGSAGVPGRPGGGGVPVSVDTGQLDEGAERVGRVRDDLREAGAGLDRLPAVAVATGADALLDALADLGRQWLALLDVAAEEAGRVAAHLRTASAAYGRAERDAASSLRPLPSLLDLTRPDPTSGGGSGGAPAGRAQ